MSEWNTFKLGEIATRIGDGLHGTPHYDSNGEYYFINGSNLVNGKIEINSNTKKVSADEYHKYKKNLNDKTILLGINGTIGNVALYQNEKCVLGKSAAYINVGNEFDKHFVKYALLNEHFQKYIKTNASGTTIKNVGLTLLREYEFDAPSDISTQTQIASILSSLDDKIELNIEMNKTLEAMAQAMFKEWFVNFNFPGFDGELVDGLPKGWRNGIIGEVLKLVYGQALKAETRMNGKFPVIGSSGIVGYHNEYLVEAPGIVIGRKGTIGEVIWIDENFFPIDTTFYVKDFLGTNDLFYHYFLLKEQEFKKITSDSAVPGLNRNQAMNNKWVIPEIKLIEKFNSIVKPYFERKQLIKNEINALTQIRDSLLPKLMAGKIEIQV